MMNRKTVFLTAVILLIAVPCFADGETVPVPIPCPPTGPGLIPHVPAQLLASGTYIPDRAELSLSFLQDVGFVTITVSNSVGETITIDFESENGTCMIPLSGSFGLYIVSVTTENEMEYYGYFVVS